jgi:hypothetical protein
MKTSKRNLLVAGAGAAAAVAIAVPLALTPADATTITTSLVAEMDGPSEVPPADPNGTGQVFVFAHESDPSALCYVIFVDQIGKPTAAHIHPGAVGEVGDPVVPLKTPTVGDTAGCVQTRERLVARILANPQNFYVNVHNARFPGGAIRGQLANN